MNDDFFKYNLYALTITNTDAIENLKLIKTTNPLNDDITIYGFSDGHVFEVLGSKYSPRASYMNNKFGNDLTNYYLREIHPFLLPLARLCTSGELTLEEMFSDLPDMLNYSYVPNMIRTFCISKNGGETLSPKVEVIKEWYQSMVLEMFLHQYLTVKDPISLHDEFEACFFAFMRFIPAQYHDVIPYKVQEMERKKRPAEEIIEPKTEKVEKPPPPKRSRTMIKPAASKGTKNIMSFFSPKA